MSEAGKRIAILTEGTYPFNDGGVSTWCDKLVTHLPEFSFDVYAVTPHPLKSAQFQPPANVTSVSQVPLWGVEHPAEWVGKSAVREMLKTRRRTSDGKVARYFAPALCLFLEGLNYTASLESAALGVDAMSLFLAEHDYEKTMKSPAVWREVRRALADEWAKSSLRGVQPAIEDANVCARWLYAFFMPLVAPVPEADVVHATASAFSAVLGLRAKIQRGTPFVLTEHGVYLRERYIAVSRSNMSQLQKAFLARLSSLISRLCYLHADLVTSVCTFNQRWEGPQGVTRDRMRVIHNGVDVDMFVPGEKPPETRNRPTVVAAARLFPLKDIETMVRACKVVRERIPDVHFILFGSLTADPEYTARIRSLIAELDLIKTFELAGVHPRPAEIYNQGDITILSSISEAFPYTVLESMACGRPVAATDVGGVSEIVGNLGKLVPPQDPKALGEACIDLLKNHEQRLTLGRRAREQIVAEFRDEVVYEKYSHLYEDLTTA